jgi:hypothetical protein
LDELDFSRLDAGDLEALWGAETRLAAPPADSG